MGIARGIVRGTVRGTVRGVVCQVNPLDFRLRTEGDSLMAGAYGVSTTYALWALMPELERINTAVGGSTMDQVKDRVLDQANAYLLPRTTIFWDGSQNGLTTVTAYCDLLADAIAALGHSRFLVIPPINPYGSTYAASEQEAVAAEMLSRWPDNFVHWEDYLEHTSNAIAAHEFYNAGVDNYHLSESGHAHMAYGLWEVLKAKGWVADKADPMISAGALMLSDFGLTEGQFIGIPIEGQVVPNIATAEAAVLVGSGDATTLGNVVDLVGPSGTTIERSGKLGLHCIVEQGILDGQNRGLILSPKALIQEYIHAHMDDDLFFSIWMRPTRGIDFASPSNPAAAPQSIFHKAQTTSAYLFHDSNGSSTIFPTDSNQIGAYATPSGNIADNIDTPILRSIGTTARSGATFDLITTGLGAGVGNGGKGVNAVIGSTDVWGSFNRGGEYSGIIYRIFVENLTVSGRSFAQVSAMERVLFAEAFAGRGRFAGDTYSDPDVVYP